MHRTMSIAVLPILLGAFVGCGGEKGAPASVSKNTPPTITAGRVIQQNVFSAGGARTGIKVSLEATASDPDGDTLTYEWSASTGNLIGSGSNVQWQDWESGATASVVVRDGHGGEATWKFALE